MSLYSLKVAATSLTFLDHRLIQDVRSVSVFNGLCKRKKSKENLKMCSSTANWDELLYFLMCTINLNKHIKKTPCTTNQINMRVELLICTIRKTHQ